MRRSYHNFCHIAKAVFQTFQTIGLGGRGSLTVAISETSQALLEFRDVPPNTNGEDDVLNALRYYWVVAKGYRLQPWNSPYLRWRMETFFGPAAADPDAGTFFRLMWAERVRTRRFLAWVAERRREQKAASRRW